MANTLGMDAPLYSKLCCKQGKMGGFAGAAGQLCLLAQWRPKKIKGAKPGRVVHHCMLKSKKVMFKCIAVHQLLSRLIALRFNRVWRLLMR